MIGLRSDAERSDLQPLSGSQRRLWYMSLLAPGDPYYNVTLVWRLAFHVDIEILRATLKHIVARHEILRTRYPVVAGSPHQEVMSSDEWDLQREETVPGDHPDLERTIRRFTRRMARSRLDLTDGPVFKAVLLTVAPDSHVLAAVVHHLAIDQWSIHIIARELNDIYSAMESGESVTLPQAVQYREYVKWELAEYARKADLLQDYWDRQLVDSPPLLQLPYDRSSRFRPALRGREYSFTIPEIVAMRLRQLSREHKASVFALMFGLYAVLLSRWTRQVRIAIGTTVAFRQDPKFNNTVGCFVNPLAITIELQPTDRFDNVFCRAREQVFGGLSHSQFPYDSIVQRARRLHVLSDELITAYIQFQPERLSTARISGCRFRPDLAVHNGRAKFPLMLNISERPNAYECVFEYDRDRFSSRRIRALAGDFTTLLTEACSNPERPISDIALSADRSRSSNTEPGPHAQEIAPETGDEKELRPIELRLAKIWRELLLVDEVGPSADFIELGGHSLLFATLAWRIGTEFSVRVGVSALSHARTVRGMATLIKTAPPISDKPTFRSATSVERIGGIPCQLDMGIWTRSSIDELFRSAEGLSGAKRVHHFATAFLRTPFQFESRRPLPLPGRLPIRLGAFDCITYVYTVLAMATARDFEDVARTLYSIRYADTGTGQIDSHPETGNIFDFAEESILVNAVERGLLRDVTESVAAGCYVEVVRRELVPIQRAHALDPMELWATPKLGSRPIEGRFISSEDLAKLDLATVLQSGDLVLLSRAVPNTSHVIDHVGFAEVDGTASYLLQATRHFACHASSMIGLSGTFTNVFYDAEHRFEQIGVGVTGPFAGDHLTFERDGLPFFGYIAGARRTLVDYVNSNFKLVSILRPTTGPTDGGASELL